MSQAAKVTEHSDDAAVCAALFAMSDNVITDSEDTAFAPDTLRIAANRIRALAGKLAIARGGTAQSEVEPAGEVAKPRTRAKPKIRGKARAKK